MTEIRCPDCPRCGHPADPGPLRFGIGVCTNLGCDVLSWNPLSTPAEIRKTRPREIPWPPQ